MDTATGTTTSRPSAKTSPFAARLFAGNAERELTRKTVIAPPYSRLVSWARCTPRARRLRPTSAPSEIRRVAMKLSTNAPLKTSRTWDAARPKRTTPVGFRAKDSGLPSTIDPLRTKPSRT